MATSPKNGRTLCPYGTGSVARTWREGYAAAIADFRRNRTAWSRATEKKCALCPTRAVTKSKHTHFPRLCHDHAYQLIRAVSWHLFMIEKLPRAKVAKLVRRDSGVVAHDIDNQEARLRRWRTSSMEPFMQRLRNAGALPREAYPVLFGSSPARHGPSWNSDDAGEKTT